jgi:hypothetical protein
VGHHAAGLTVRRRIERTRGGEIRLRLPREERDLLRRLPGELLGLIEDDPRDPGLRRLFPPAHEDDPEAEAGYRRLVGESLLDGRREALQTLERTSDADVLREEDLGAWLTALNDLRLVLGTRLGIDESFTEVDPDDPRAPGLGLYAYLSWLQEQAVEAAAAVL